MPRGVCALVVAVAVAVVMVGCGSGGGGGDNGDLAPGSVRAIDQGGQVTVEGRVAFRDATGAPVNGPQGGVLVVAGAGSRAVGTNALGEFTIDNLPGGADIPVPAGAPGWFPGKALIRQVAVVYLAALICRMDPDPIDDPVIAGPFVSNPADGLTYLQGIVPDDTRVAAFFLPGQAPATPYGPLPANPVDVLPVLYTPAVMAGFMDYKVSLEPALGAGIPTGSFHAFGFTTDVGTGGMEPLESCGLTLSNYSRTGKVVKGQITRGGRVVSGAEVDVAAQGNPSATQAHGTTGLGGHFEIEMGGDPVFPIRIHVQTAHHVCIFYREVP